MAELLGESKKREGERERLNHTGQVVQGSAIDGNLVGTTRLGSRTSGASKLRCRSMQQPMGEWVPYLLGSGSSLRSHCWVPCAPFVDGNSRCFRSRHLGCPRHRHVPKKCQCHLDRWYSDIANSWPKKMENENNNNLIN